MKPNRILGKDPPCKLELDKKPQHQQKFRLSDKQIIALFLGIVTLLSLAILRGQQSALFHIKTLRWESQSRFCRVFFTVQNPRKNSIPAQAIIHIFTSLEPAKSGGQYLAMDQSGSAKVPIQLAGHETRLITTDVTISGGLAGCNYVEIQRVAGQSFH